MDFSSFTSTLMTHLMAHHDDDDDLDRDHDDESGSRLPTGLPPTSTTTTGRMQAGIIQRG